MDQQRFQELQQLKIGEEPATKNEAAPPPTTIASLHNGIIKCLRAVLFDLDASADKLEHVKTLESAAAALLFWGIEHGVTRGDVDRTLQNSKFLRDTVIRVFISIGQLLDQGMM
jgi:hypothetical protein